MVDPVGSTSNNQNPDNDDWEVAVDTGEFDKRIEQQEKARAAVQESIISPASLSANDDDARAAANVNMMKSNKPIRILKRPTSQSQLVNNNESNTSNQTNTPSTITNPTVISSNNNNSSTPFSNNISSSTTVPIVSIIPRNQTKDSSSTTTSSQSTVYSTGSTKPPIKTYEQRELEYKLARLRIMGEEESSAKDDDEIPVVDSIPVVNTDEISSKTSSTMTRAPLLTSNKMAGLSQQPLPLQSHSTPGSYASNLYALNNAPSAPSATINFTPNTNSTTPFSSPNFPQSHYHGAYSAPYSHMPLPQRYPLPATTTTTLYMTSTAPFVTTTSSSSSSTSSTSYHYPPQHPHMTTNSWYPYQHHQQQQQQQQTPYGTQQYGHPQ